MTAEHGIGLRITDRFDDVIVDRIKRQFARTASKPTERFTTYVACSSPTIVTKFGKVENNFELMPQHKYKMCIFIHCMDISLHLKFWRTVNASVLERLLYQYVL